MIRRRLFGVVIGVVLATAQPALAQNWVVQNGSNSVRANTPLPVVSVRQDGSGSILRLYNGTTLLYDFGLTGLVTPLTLTTTALGTTSTDGLTLANTTLATAGVTVQISPRFRLRGTAWDTSASETVDWFMENLPATAATPTSTLKFGHSLNGAAATYPLTLTSAGQLQLIRQLVTYGGSNTIPDIVSAGNLQTGFYLGGDIREAVGSTLVSVTSATNKQLTANLIFSGDATYNIGASLASRPLNLYLAGKALNYNAVATAGQGVPSIYGYGDAAAVVNTGTASIATYTVGAADGTFEVGCNILVTVSTTHTFSCDVTYTDESSAARTMVLPMAALAGTFVTTGLMTNITGAGPYESPTMNIRAKATTAITVRTSAGGTFTTVTYNARGIIKQVG